MAKHILYDVINAWANGEDIQFKVVGGLFDDWTDYELRETPNFDSRILKWRVKPKNDYSEIAEKVLNEVDCETIHKVMVATNHKWYSYIEDDYVVPCISTIKNKVRKLVVALIAENLSEVSGGGLTVKWYRPVGGCFRDTIQVKFQPVVDVFIPVKD